MTTFLFVDGSYYCFYRFYALQQWWRNAFPEEPLDPQNLSPVFVEKFRKIFVEHLRQLPKKLNIAGDDIQMFVGKDCKRDQIWRTALYPAYKATRESTPGISTFFQMVYEEDLFRQGGATAILAHPRLEADDCIALSVMHLRKERPGCTIHIVTSDHDYLQLHGPDVHLTTLSFKPVRSETNDATMDLQLKILMGDVSDNIPSVFPKCGVKTALKCMHDPVLLAKKINGHDAQYALNKQLVDFKCIPSEHASEFLLQAEKLLRIVS